MDEGDIIYSCFLSSTLLAKYSERKFAKVVLNGFLSRMESEKLVRRCEIVRIFAVSFWICSTDVLLLMKVVQEGEKVKGVENGDDWQKAT